MDVAWLKNRLGLVPLPEEGGFYRETYRAATQLTADSLPKEYQGPRAVATAIYYLLTPEEFSGLHRVRSDEIFHFYLGDPVWLTTLNADGSGHRHQLGHDLQRGMVPQLVVPAGVWQGAQLAPGGRWALMGATVAPGFEFADFEVARREVLLASHPQFQEDIVALTRQ